MKKIICSVHQYNNIINYDFVCLDKNAQVVVIDAEFSMTIDINDNFSVDFLRQKSVELTQKLEAIDYVFTRQTPVPLLWRFGDIRATETTFLSTTAADIPPFTPTIPSFSLSPDRRWKEDRSYPAREARAIPPDLTFTLKYA